MPGSTITTSVCSKLIETAAHSCQPVVAATPIPPPEHAMSAADSLAALSTAFVYGSILLALLVVIAGFAWAKSVAHEAKEMAEKEVKKWLQDVGRPMILREVDEFLRAFPRERPISEDDVEAMVAAAGADGKEGGNGKE